MTGRLTRALRAGAASLAMHAASALLETGAAVGHVLHGVAHRTALLACRLGELPAGELDEPTAARARRVAGLPAVSADVDTAFYGIVENFHLEEA